MRPVPTAIVTRFADAFCYGRSGYSLRELHDLFVQYQVDVPTLDSSVSTTKGGYFQSCVGVMTPENQRQFLYDLCDDPPPATGPLPDEQARRGLLSILAAADGVSPLADGLSQVTLRAVRNQWFTAASRLPHSASSAITAARALLESTCQTILVERGEAPDTSGDLGRLYNQTRRALQIEASAGVPQALHQLLNGLVQVVNGLAQPPQVIVNVSQQTAGSARRQPDARLEAADGRLMGKIEKIEQEIQALSPDELAQFRAWFLEYDWAVWDRRLERDAEAGRLDDLAAKALRDHAAGKTTPL